METKKQVFIRPTFGGSYGHGWDVMIKYFLILLLVTIVSSLIMAPMSIGNLSDMDHFNWGDMHFDFFSSQFFAWGILAFMFGVFALAYMLLIVPVFRYGADFMFVQAARDIRPEFETLVMGFKQNYLYIILASLLKKALIMLGFMFLFVPGIIVACRLAFVSYLVMDKKLDPIVAIEESWRMTKGHGWTIFGMSIVSFFLFIAGLILFFFGSIPAVMWIRSSFASLYEAVLIEKNGEAEEVAVVE